MARSLATSRLDGISIYSRAILEYMLRDHNLNIEACVIGMHANALAQLNLKNLQTHKIHTDFSSIAAWQTISGYSHPTWRHIELKFDLFHATDHLIPKLKTKPVVATVMDAIALTQPSLIRSRMRHLKAYAFKKAIQSATRIITISNYSARELIEHADIPESKIDVTPLACDQRFFMRMPQGKRLQRLSRLGVDGSFFLYVGTIQPRKNIERLIRAYCALPKEIRSNHALVIAGGLREDMQGLLPLLNCKIDVGCVKWLKYVEDEDLVILMQSSSALVVPSLYEGFGLPALEGFASDVPVLSSNSTSLPEVCGNAALLFDPLSVEAIRDAMLSVVEKPELAIALRKRGCARVSEFSWERTVELTVQSYNKAS